jgi:hypothetical protein
MKNFKNVRAVKFTVEFDGMGCVNFDSKSQSFFLNSNGLWSEETKNGNILLAKKIFDNYVTSEGDTATRFKYKVSSECIRHAMYEDVMPFQNPNISSIPTILYNAIAMPCYISRGYMFTVKGKNSLRKKSAVTVCDAVEDGAWRNKLTFDFHSRTGEKNTEVKEKDDAKDTVIYNIENVGNITYKSEGYIDMTELQFIPGDPLYDRMAIDADGGVNEALYLNALKRNFPSFNGGFDYYYIDNTYSNDEWAERGILLDTESVNTMVKDILKRIINVNVVRRNAYFKFKSLKITVIMDDGEREENIEITSDNVMDFNFEYFRKYSVADEKKIAANKNIVKEVAEAIKEQKKEEKRQQQQNKKTTKKSGKGKKSDDVELNEE